MSEANGNGVRYFTSSDEEAVAYLTEEDLVAIAKKLSHKTQPEWLSIKNISVVIGLLITLGGIVWAASSLVSSKASAVDVSAIDKALGEMKIILDNMNDDLKEIRDDLDKVEDSLKK